MKNAKKLLSIFLSVLVTLTLFGFTSTKGVKADTLPVQLYYVNGEDRGATSDNFPFIGYIAVQKSLAQKNVIVHYNISGSNTWNDLNAHYVKDNPSDGCEIWSFNLNAPGTSQVQFAIRCDSNGTSYWDNNNGKNYTVGEVPGSYGNYGKAHLRVDENFGKSMLFAFDVNSYQTYYGPRVCGNVVLHDIPGDKAVTIRYSYDNWATYSETQAQYGTSISQSGTQLWSFDVPANVSAKQISFAVRYTVNGVSYWDNNFGDNYNYNLN